jgi:molecular chaperone DnaJ
MSKKTCPKCNGSGMYGERVVTPFAVMFVDWDCPRCNGRGFINKRHLKRKGILK